jgi:hypothetical protein
MVQISFVSMLWFSFICRGNQKKTLKNRLKEFKLFFQNKLKIDRKYWILLILKLQDIGKGWKFKFLIKEEEEPKLYKCHKILV